MELLAAVTAVMEPCLARARVGSQLRAARWASNEVAQEGKRVDSQETVAAMTGMMMMMMAKAVQKQLGSECTGSTRHMLQTAKSICSSTPLDGHGTTTSTMGWEQVVPTLAAARVERWTLTVAATAAVSASCDDAHVVALGPLPYTKYTRYRIPGIMYNYTSIILCCI